jgi:hypothetical protein
MDIALQNFRMSLIRKSFCYGIIYLIENVIKLLMKRLTLPFTLEIKETNGSRQFRLCQGIKTN